MAWTPNHHFLLAIVACLYVESDAALEDEDRCHITLSSDLSKLYDFDWMVAFHHSRYMSSVWTTLSFKRKYCKILSVEIPVRILNNWICSFQIPCRVNSLLYYFLVTNVAKMSLPNCFIDTIKSNQYACSKLKICARNLTATAIIYSSHLSDIVLLPVCPSLFYESILFHYRVSRCSFN